VRLRGATRKARGQDEGGQRGDYCANGALKWRKLTRHEDGMRKQRAQDVPMVAWQGAQNTPQKPFIGGSCPWHRSWGILGPSG
jgi:hypothetical protein